VDALANAREAITGYVASMVAHGEPVPFAGHPMIATTALVPPKAVA